MRERAPSGSERTLATCLKCWADFVNEKETFLVERVIEWAAQATWATSHGKRSH